MTEFSDIWYHSADNLRLYARDYACRDNAVKNPHTVLCMHGLTRNSADFAGLAAHLCQRYRLLVVDQRGRGRSDYDPVSANYTVLTYVQDMFTLLDQLGLERIITVGTSMGGLMSFLMAAMQSARIRAMVINDVGPELDPRGLARIVAYVGKLPPVADWDQAVAQCREVNAGVFPDFSDRQWLDFARGIYVERDGVPVLAHDPAIAEPMGDDGASAVPPDLWPVFRGIAEIPMLVVRGEASDILSRACVERMRAIKPDLQSVTVPRRGHAPLLTEPAALQAIDTFLDQF
ncbi:MAG: alpha/beta hydrolase [Halioglobus sp.]|nr:alpha/beta hydrolase [Halioglobus sp.]